MKYRLSVAEIWHRPYLIEAKSPKEAWTKYRRYSFGSGDVDFGSGDVDSVQVLDPEYIDDMSEGHIMWEDNDEQKEVDFT